MIALLVTFGIGGAYANELGLGGYAGGWALPPASEFPPDAVLGARLRYRWSSLFGVELAGGRASSGFDPRGELLAFFPSTAKVTPFVSAGGGGLIAGGDAAWLADLGGGIDAELGPLVDFRSDLRLRLLGESTPTTSVLFTAGLQLHTRRVRDGDGDGVTDRADACVHAPEDRDGFADEDGCPEPDNDSDLVLDGDDRCPDEAEDRDGYDDDDGCPDLDEDHDGIPDLADNCGNQPEDKDGFEDTDGCPDRDDDGDHIAEDIDRCPAQPETFNTYQDGDGCPDEIPAEVAKFSGVIPGVNFATGKAVLLKSSRAVLDEAVDVMKRFPDLRLEVQGHTDDVGDDAKNMQLSQDRAAAVVAYLVEHGVAADRLVARGYGETAPKVPNDSNANRALNRRVEFKRI